MKYEKPVVKIIDVKEDIITGSSSTNPASDCGNAASKTAAKCTSSTYESYQACAKLFNH